MKLFADKRNFVEVFWDFNLSFIIFAKVGWSFNPVFGLPLDFKVADPSSCSTLLNVSYCLDLLFRLVFLSKAKHFSSFTISLDLRHSLISKVLLAVSQLWFLLNFLLFLLCVALMLLFNIVSFAKSRRHWGWQLTVWLSNDSAVILLHLSRMR